VGGDYVGRDHVKCRDCGDGAQVGVPGPRTMPVPARSDQPGMGSGPLAATASPTWPGWCTTAMLIGRSTRSSYGLRH
jgi:hypothetical protein